MVVHKQRFQEIKISFPFRGHSYLEYDWDMVLVNQKTCVETPEGQLQEFRASRMNPSPFSVLKMEQDVFRNVTEYIKLHHRVSCPIPTRPLREILFSQAHPRLLHYREDWNGPFATAVVSMPVGRRNSVRQQPLVPLYPERLPICEAKYSDLQVLMSFCSMEAQHYFTDFPRAAHAADLCDSEWEDCSLWQDQPVQVWSASVAADAYMLFWFTSLYFTIIDFCCTCT